MNLQFADPWLLLLLPVPIALWLWRRWTKRAALRYPAIGLLDGIPRARVPRLGGEALRLAAVLCATLALAGPRTPDLKTRLPTEGIAIVVCLDTSGSMEEPFIWDTTSSPISRREAAKRAFKLFVAGGDGPDGIHFDGRSTERGTDAIGLVTFSNWPNPVCPPTTNHSVLLNILNDVQPASARDTGTNVGDAIAQGLILLDRSPLKRRVLILLSDGEHNVDFADKARKPVFPKEAASIASNLGIPIYTIDTGGDPPLDNPTVAEQRRKGREINEEVASTTGGKSFIANEGPQLLDVCHQIDAMEHQPIVSSVYRRYHEFYPWLALAAVGLAALAFGLDQTVWRRVP